MTCEESGESGIKHDKDGGEEAGRGRRFGNVLNGNKPTESEALRMSSGLNIRKS